MFFKITEEKIKKWEMGKKAKKLINAKANKDERIREAAIEALTNLTETLIQDLSDSNTTTRGEAVNLLGEIGNEKAVEPLKAVLEDKKRELREGSIPSIVRARAARVLGELGNTSAIETLAKALLDDNELIREISSGALKNIGTPAALKALEDVKKEEGKEVASPKKYATFIKRDDLDRMKIEFDEQINLRVKVVERLKNAPEEKKTEIAVELLKHPNYKTRLIVISLIARLGIKTIGVWFELANRLADDHKEVRLEAAKAFWSLGGVDYAIRSLRDEFNTQAHVSSIEAFKGIQVLRQASFSPTFKNLLEENWPEFPKIKKRIGELPKDVDDVFKEALRDIFDVEMEQKISKIIAAGGDTSEYDDVAHYLKRKKFMKTGKI